MSSKYRLTLLLFIPLFLYGQDYYFVAGQNGRWSDIQNWRTTSGGTIQHSQVPTSASNVIIDDQSFPGTIRTLDIDLDLSTCGDLTIRTGQAFTLHLDGNSSLNISGSVTGHSNTDYELLGDAKFEGTGSKTVDFGKEVRVGNLTIGQGGGTWNFTSSFRVEQKFILLDGEVHFTGITIDAHQGEFMPSSGLEAHFTDSELTFRATDREVFYASSPDFSLSFFNTAYLNIMSRNSSISISGKFPSILVVGNNPVDWDNLSISAGRYATFNIDSPTPDPNVLNLNSLRLDGNIRMNTIVNAREVTINPGSYILLRNGGSYSWENITAQGTCEDQIAISSGQAGIHTGNTTIEHAVLSNLAFTGQASAISTALVGTTSGITVTGHTAQIFYWVNGEGQWHDPRHWSNSSGGSSSGCLPSGNDRVIFDRNSFNTPADRVIISENAFVDDISWQLPTNGNEIVLETSTHLFINGSLTMASKPAVSNSGTIHFVSSDDETLDTRDTEINGRIRFVGSGSWTMQSDFTSLETLALRRGTLRLGGFRLQTNQFQSVSTQPRVFDISGSHWLIQTHSGYNIQATDIITTNFELNSTGSHTFIYVDIWFRMYNREYTPTMMQLDSVTVDFGRPQLIAGTSITIAANFADFKSSVRFHGVFDFNETHFQQGKHYTFENRASLTTRNIQVNSGCPAQILFHGMAESFPAQLRVPVGTKIPGLIAQNIHVVEGNITAPDGLDNGNNRNIDFQQGGSRTLYWVGGPGDWQESAHWALTSGGSGGECPPGPMDDVVFDENSFTSANDLVSNSTSGLSACRNLIWTADARSGNFRNIRSLFIFGSVYLERTLEPSNTGRLSLMCDTLAEFYLHGSSLGYVEVNGTGDFHFNEDASIYTIGHRNGRLSFNDAVYNLAHLTLYWDIDQSLMLHNATLQFDAVNRSTLLIVLPNDQNFGIDNTGDGKIVFVGDQNSISLRENAAYGKMIIRNPASSNRISYYGATGICRADYLEVDGDNTLTGVFELDTFIVQPGHHLIFQGITHLKVNDYYRYFGNNCLSSTWRNQNPGSTPVNFEATAATTVVQDHIQMSGIAGSSPVDLPAGQHSTNISHSNPGWLFENTVSGDETDGILGPDQVFCGQIDDIVLNQGNLFNAHTTQWNESISEPELLVNTPGEYRVHLTFSSGCELYDTLQISLLDQVGLDLGEDRVICEGDSVVLTSVPPTARYDVAWSTGSTDRNLVVYNSGEYKVSVNSSRCSLKDSVNIEVVSVPALDLGQDIVLCEGDSALLGIPPVDTGYQITWSTMEHSTSIVVHDQDVYHVSIGRSGCASSDTVRVDVLTRPTVDLGPDIDLCEGDSARLHDLGGGSGYELKWSTTSTESEILVAASGRYSLTARAGVCTHSDTLEVRVLPVPNLDLASLVDTSRCEGDTILLDLSSLGSDIQWNGMDVTGPVNIHASGTYHARVAAGTCSDEDSVDITFYPPPVYEVITPGPVCAGSAVDLRIQSPGNQIRWEDGNTLFDRAVIPTDSRYYMFELWSPVCSLQDSVEVSLLSVPVTNILYEKDFLCPGDELVLEVSTTGDRVAWQDGSTQQRVRIDQPGKYSVRSYLGTCSDSTAVSISRIDTPDPGLPGDTVMCEDEELTLSPSVSGLTDVHWNGDPGSVTSVFSGEQMVLFQALFKGCPVTDTTLIRTMSCGPSTISLPNAFSPNGDSINDTYLPVYDPSVTIHSYQMQIFDRWGGLLFTTDNPDKGWTGMDLDGVYAVSLKMEYTNDSHRRFRFDDSGEVVIIR